MSFKRKILLVFFLANAFGTGIYTTYTYNLEKATVIRGLDRLLIAGAYALAELYPIAFHDRLVDEHSISYEEHRQTCIRLARLSQQMGVKYLYSFVLHKGKIVFATSSATPGEIDRKYWDPFFSEYGSATAVLHRAFQENRLVFDYAADMYGNFRSVYIPFVMPSGRVFVAGADITLESIDAQLERILAHYLLIGVCIFLATGCIGYQVIHTISLNLQALSSYTQTLVQNDFCPPLEVQQGIEYLAGNNRDEVGTLAKSIVTMRQALNSYLERIRESTASQEKIESELRIAHSIQMSMVPQTFPPPEEVGGFSVQGLLQPAREVGGDFFDFFFVDADHLAFTIGDVAGKGVPAALFMVMVRTLVRAHLSRNSEPRQVLEKINSELSRENETAMFSTLLLGILDIRTGQIIMANAGHPPPFLVKADGTIQPFAIAPGFPVGVMDTPVFSTQRSDLHPGETLVFYTDGVTEAVNPTLAPFGEALLEKHLAETFAHPVAEVLRTLFCAVDTFSGSQPQFDDMTALGIRFLEEKAQTFVPDHSIHLRNDPREIPRLHTFLELFGNRYHLGEDLIHDVTLAAEELMVNAMSHGKTDQSELEVTLNVRKASQSIDLVFTDNGQAFNPLAAPPPDLASSLEERPIGGLGVFLARELTDIMEYERRGDHNVLRLRKSLSSRPSVPPSGA